MKKIILLIFCVFILSGCGKQMEDVLLHSESESEDLSGTQTSKQSREFSVDEYYLCSEGNTDNKRKENCFLLDSEGNIVESFPGYYVRLVIDSEGLLLDRYAGNVSSGTLLVLASSKDTDAPVGGVYTVGENKWLIEPKEKFTGHGWNETGRLTELQFGTTRYTYHRGMLSENQQNADWYGQKGLHTEKDASGTCRIIDKNGKTLLDAETFYQLNKPMVQAPVPISDYYSGIGIKDVMNENCFLVNYMGKEYLCSAEGKIILIKGIDYLSSDYFFSREEHSSRGETYASDKYLSLCDSNRDKYHIKVENNTATLLDIPESDTISYKGNGFYLLEDQNQCHIYDGKENMETDTFDAEGFISVDIMGQKSYLAYTVESQHDEHVGVKIAMILNRPDIVSFKLEHMNEPIIADDGIVLLSNYDEQNNKITTFMMNRSGECIKEMEGKIVWADKNYYLVSDEEGFSVFDMKDQLIAEYK